MILNLSNIEESHKAIDYLELLIKKGSKIELKKCVENRTSQQNRALHKFFVLISEQLNDMSIDFCYTGLKGFELSTRYTPDLVKNFFWRPIQIALFDIESTKKLDTKQINEITDVIVKFFGDKGVVIEFPNKEQLINN